MECCFATILAAMADICTVTALLRRQLLHAFSVSSLTSIPVEKILICVICYEDIFNNLMTNTLDTIIDKYRESEGNVITLLQDTQEAFGYVPREAVEYLSRTLGIAPSRFYGVATFYVQFHLKPRGKNIVTICCGTACHVKGSERLLNSVTQELGLTEGRDMTEDGQFTLERVNCVGACSIAPVSLINKKVQGKATAEKILKEIRAIKGPADAKE
jgi:NADH:ubiquinone oxidoreductase subunit E